MIKNQKSASTADSPKRREQNISRYIEAVGRRKTSVARVRIFKTNKPSIIVNDKDFSLYFPTIGLRKIVQAPLETSQLLNKLKIEVKIKGGGISSQAGALRHGISRAIQKLQPELHKPLKDLGFLKRDSRMKERRKFGLKKARKAPQWSKR